MLDSETAKTLQAISAMTRTEGWAYLKRDFDFHINQLQEQINEPGGNEMKYSEGDLLKIKLKFLKDLLAYPENFGALIVKEQLEDADPYK